MIKNVQMRGIKGSTHQQELTGRDIIIGPNGAGKTTLLQAIGLTLYGHVPGEGKALEETMKLTSGNSLMVGIETDGFVVSRSFNRKDEKITQKLDLNPPCGSRTIADKERRIEEVLGKVLVMMDFNEFIGLSDMKRREFIYALVENPNELGDYQSRAVFIKSLLLDKLSSFDETTDPKEIAIYEETVAECADLFDGGTSIQEELQSALDYAKEQSQFWKKEREKSISASQKISEYKNEIAETDRNLDANTVRLGHLRDEEKNLASKKAATEATNTATKTKNERIVAVQNEIKVIRVSVNPHNSVEIRENIAKLAAGLKKLDNSEAVTKLSADLKEMLEQIPTLKKDVEAQRDEWNRLKALKTASKELIEKLTSQSGQCPLDKRIECNHSFSGLISELQGEIEKLSTQMKEIGSKGIVIKEKHDALEKSTEETRNTIAHLQKEEVDVLRSNEEIQKQINALEESLKKTENFDTEKTTKLAAKIEELKSLLPENGGLWPLTDTTPIIAEEAKIAASIRELTDTMAEQTKARNALLNLKNSMGDSVEAGYRLESWKKVIAELGPKGLQGRLVKDTLEPLTTAIQEKFSHMGIEKKFFFQTINSKGKEVFQFGWEWNGKHTLFDALSTGEKLLLLIAMMTTIVERLNPPLKILAIDNAECLDRGNYMSVIEGLAKAGKNLDNIIICGVVENVNPDDVPGWNVCDLGANMAPALGGRIA